MRNERGFSLIEIIIVLVIIAILTAIVAPRFLGAKKSAFDAQTKAAGSAYASAIAQYQTDNGNKLPTTMATLQGKSAGPANLLGKPYMGNLPAGVADGVVEVNMSTAATAPASCPLTPGTTSATARGYVRLCSGGENSNAFTITMASRKTAADPWTPLCATGSTPPAGATRC